MHEVLVNRLGGLSLPRKSVVRLTDRPDMALDVYRGRKTTTTMGSTFSSAFENITHFEYRAMRSNFSSSFKNIHIEHRAMR